MRVGCAIACYQAFGNVGSLLSAQAYRNWRYQPIVFDKIDVVMMIEAQ